MIEERQKDRWQAMVTGEPGVLVLEDLYGTDLWLGWIDRLGDESDDINIKWEEVFRG